jgi:hypothetical protein
MKSAITNSIAAGVTARPSCHAPFGAGCEDISCPETLVAELIFKNQHLRFMLFSVQNQLEAAHAIVAGLYRELPEHPDICRLQNALSLASPSADL